MIHLSALDAARLLGSSPKVRSAANQVRKAQQVTFLHDKVLTQLVGLPGGRHTRGKGFVEDRAKMNEATLLGWTVLEVTPEHIKSGQLRAWLLAAFNQDPDQRIKP